MGLKVAAPAREIGKEGKREKKTGGNYSELPQSPWLNGGCASFCSVWMGCVGVRRTCVCVLRYRDCICSASTSFEWNVSSHVNLARTDSTCDSLEITLVSPPLPPPPPPLLSTSFIHLLQRVLSLSFHATLYICLLSSLRLSL